MFHTLLFDFILISVVTSVLFSTHMYVLLSDAFSLVPLLRTSVVMFKVPHLLISSWKHFLLPNSKVGFTQAHPNVIIMKLCACTVCPIT